MDRLYEMHEAFIKRLQEAEKIVIEHTTRLVREERDLRGATDVALREHIGWLNETIRSAQEALVEVNKRGVR